MNRRKLSKIWFQFTDDEFTVLVKKSNTYKEILSHFGLMNKGNNNNTLKNRISELKIDTSHIQNHNSFQKMILLNKLKEIQLDKVMVEHSSYCRGTLKKRLLREGLLKNECSICGQQPEWNGKPLVMILDHINGVSDDNRRENLRLVCANCNCQLDTHCGKQNKKKHYFCKTCHSEIRKQSDECVNCSGLKRRKSERPSKEELEKMVAEIPMTVIGKQFGVSDNAVKKWCKNYGIHFENRQGYWTKKNAKPKPEKKVQGTHCVHKDGKFKRVRLEEIDDYLKVGWKRGSGMNQYTKIKEINDGCRKNG